MGNSNSHVIHPAHHPKKSKGLNRNSLKNAEEDLTREKDNESMNEDKLRMMPNIHTVASAPLLVDNINELAAKDHGSGDQHLISNEKDTVTILYVNEIADPHSIDVILKDERLKKESISLDCDSTSPIDDNKPGVIQRAGSYNSGLGTPITKKPVVNMVPITPLLEISSENNTASLSIDEKRFESLVDSNAPSYGSVNVSFDNSSSFLYSNPSLRYSGDLTNVDMRRENSNRSTSDMLKLISIDDEDIVRRNKLLAKRRELVKSLVKYNSCSTIFADRLFVFPGMAEMLHSVSYFLDHQIQQNVSSRNLVKTEDIFSENLNPISKHFQFYKSIPDNEVIYRYLECIFHSAELNVECAILSLIYIERLLLNTEITLHSSNWARIVLGAIMLASKVWDDHAIWNIDYCQIFPEMKSSDLNRLERRYLLGLQYNVGVRLSTYTKYYFALKEFAENFKPLTREPKALTIKDFKKLNQQDDISDHMTSSESIHPDTKGVMVTKLSAKLLEELQNCSSKLDRSVSDSFYVPRSVPAQIL